MLDHPFQLGDIVTLEKAKLYSEDYDYWDLVADGWELDNDDCEPAEDGQ
jgi:hypothetical protein